MVVQSIPCHPSLKPIIARVRLQRLTTFYPLARGQPHPACALRWNRLQEHALSEESVTSVTLDYHGHVHFKPL